MTYTPTDYRIVLRGCAYLTVVNRYSVPFGEREIVYLKHRAEKGFLEKVAIKRINLVGSVFNYVDSTNRVWLENELLWHNDALALAIAYWEDVEEKLIHQAGRC